MNYEATTEQAPFTAEQESALRQIVIDRAPSALQRLADAEDDAAAFRFLPSAAFAAFHLGRFGDAREFAERTLALAATHTKNWNYGNAIHIGHAVLGLLAVNAEDYSTAAQELHASGGTPGSPQLKTFGPTMQLAKALLQRGRTEPVLAYFIQCRAFWEMGETWLDLWEGMVREGRVPNFHSYGYG